MLKIGLWLGDEKSAVTGGIGNGWAVSGTKVDVDSDNDSASGSICAWGIMIPRWPSDAIVEETVPR